MPTLKTYAVSWIIELDATSPLEAAREARKVQLDPDSTAVVFNVAEAWTKGPLCYKSIDLDDPEK